MSYYQGDYYQGDVFRRLRRFTRKRIAPALRRAAPLLAFVPGVGVVGAGAIGALAKSKRPNQTTADTLMRVLEGPTPEGVRKSNPILRSKGRAKAAAPRRAAAAAPRRAAAAPRGYRTVAVSDYQRRMAARRGVTLGRTRRVAVSPRGRR